MDEVDTARRSAERKIRNASIAAALVGLGSSIIIFTYQDHIASPMLLLEYLVGAAVAFVFAYAIYQKWPLAAAGMFVFFLYCQIRVALVLGLADPVRIGVAIVILYFLFEGMRGMAEYQKLPAASPPGAGADSASS